MSNANIAYQKLDENEQKIFKMRHSAEHILTMAMRKFYPKMKMAMGPATEEGFYFDVDLGDEKIVEEDLKKIEKEMYRLINANLKFERVSVSVAEARKIFVKNEYKQEWLDEIEAKGEEVTLYYTGKDTKDAFVDLCSGPHVEESKQVGVIKLLSLAGAYWRGDEKNKMLTRIYGTAFGSKEELDNYIWLKAEALRRDHKKIGKEMDLFIFSELVGKGLPIYTFKGTILRNAVFQYSKQLSTRLGYKEVSTPNINRAELFKISGHYEKYKEDMIKAVSQYDKDEMFFKPMNCPQHTQIFASKPRSYKDLPFRVMDCANLMRDERPGEINGILRPRLFAQDDGHCFCAEEQAESEIKNVIDVVLESLKTYGLKYKIRLSLWDPEKPEKYLGTKEEWDKSQNILRGILKDGNYDYYEGVGEAAFYAPKLDFMAIDAIGRSWQICTAQIDLFLPKRFGLEYTDENGQKKTPVMIHRAIIGSAERFLGIYIEHTEGAFPLWMSPVQVCIIPISEKVLSYAKEVEKTLQDADIRVELSDDNDSMQKRIRNAEKQKVPYMIILGEKEAEDKTVSLRQRGRKDLGILKLDQVIADLKKEIEEKRV